MKINRKATLMGWVRLTNINIKYKKEKKIKLIIIYEASVQGVH